MPNRLKLVLRRSCRQIRENLSFEYQRRVSAKVCSRIQTLQQYRHAKRIALYQAMGGEINLTSLWDSAPLQGKYCYFPGLNEDKTLSFLPATPRTQFIKNRYGINEPNVDKSQALTPNSLDIIFIPVVAFDEYGTRLGMGAGYYDRTLAQKDQFPDRKDYPLLIGVAYEFQRYFYIEPESWDIPLTAVVTERKIYWSNREND